MVYFGLHALSWTHGLAPMWSGLYLISTFTSLDLCWVNSFRVNALSGLYLISTVSSGLRIRHAEVWCQCPLGLIPHFYGGDDPIRLQLLQVSMPSRAYTSFLRETYLSLLQYVLKCQCPLGLIPHFYWSGNWWENRNRGISVNALSGLYLISTVPLQKPRFYAVSRACFCRYLSEYSDNSCFSCMLTFWTYLMRCTYPWHWIKYSTKYNRCHLIFSLSW